MSGCPVRALRRRVMSPPARPARSLPAPRLRRSARVRGQRYRRSTSSACHRRRLEGAGLAAVMPVELHACCVDVESGVTLGAAAEDVQTTDPSCRERFQHPPLGRVSPLLLHPAHSVAFLGPLQPGAATLRARQFAASAASRMVS
jgi:hypothetical protein